MMHYESKAAIIFLLGALWAYTMVASLNAIHLMFT